MQHKSSSSSFLLYRWDVGSSTLMHPLSVRSIICCFNGFSKIQSTSFQYGSQPLYFRLTDMSFTFHFTFQCKLGYSFIVHSQSMAHSSVQFLINLLHQSFFNSQSFSNVGIAIFVSGTHSKILRKAAFQKTKS